MKNEKKPEKKIKANEKRRKSPRRSKYEEVFKIDLNFDEVLALAATGLGGKKK